MKILVALDEDGHFQTKPIMGNVVEMLNFIKEVQPDHYQNTLHDLDLNLCYVNDYSKRETLNLVEKFTQRGIMEVVFL